MIRITMRVVAAAALMLSATAAGAATSVGTGDVIAAAVANNLTTKLAHAQDDAARARVLQAASSLLPSVLGTASQSRVYRENLAAQGLTFGGIPSLIGPYNSFDARFQLTQTLFDLSTIRRYRAAGAGRDLAASQEALAREQVAAAAALSYIEAVRARKAVASAQADADLADSLLKLAQDQHGHGTATGLDVVRAKTRSSDAQVALLRAQVAEREAGLRLKRLAGWPLSQELDLKDDLATDTTALPAIEDSLTLAGAARPEILVARGQLRVDDELLAAAKSERAPSLTASANIGLSGNQPDGGARTTGSIGAGLSLPIFSGGAITGRIDEAGSVREQSAARLADIRVQVEEDVRLAYQDSQEAAQEAQAAAQTVELAQQELRMSQDRYGAGTGDNIEVVTAQAELAQARDGYVASLAKLQDARVNLAAALGQAQTFTL